MNELTRTDKMGKPSWKFVLQESLLGGKALLFNLAKIVFYLP